MSIIKYKGEISFTIIDQCLLVASLASVYTSSLSSGVQTERVHKSISTVSFIDCTLIVCT